MSIKLALCLLAAACTTAVLLNDKPASKTKTSPVQLGMSLDDPRVINRRAACPPDCPLDCKELFDQGNVNSGPYIIYISTDDMRPLLVYCDMETSGGGWVIFQKRVNGAEDFYRDWVEYVDGFGQLSSEYWLGLNNLHLLLAQKNYRLRVDLVDFNSSIAYAEYRHFTVGSPLNKYALGINMYQSGGTAGDSLKYQHTNVDATNMKFSTRDQENDMCSGSCAVSWHSAWWYNNGGYANLNGNYTTNTASSTASNIFWHSWRSYYALKSTEMKFRPM